MTYLIMGLILCLLYIAYEMYSAPQMDEQTGRIIKPGKKLKDLWRKK